MVVIVLIVILVLMLLPALSKTRRHHHGHRSVNNLKQSSLALKIFASDNIDRYPYQVRPPLVHATSLATISLTNANPAGPAHWLFPAQTEQAAWAHWGALSNELGSPKILLNFANPIKRNCIATDWSTNHQRGFFSPEGHRRMTGHSSHQLNRPDYGDVAGYDNSISYFLSFDADETIPAGILAGEFTLNSNGRAENPHQNPAPAGNQYLRDTDFERLTWVTGGGGDGAWSTRDKGGVLALTDGSVVVVDSVKLREAAHESTNAWRKNSMHLLIPR